MPEHDDLSPDFFSSIISDFNPPEDLTAFSPSLLQSLTAAEHVLTSFDTYGLPLSKHDVGFLIAAAALVPLKHFRLLFKDTDPSNRIVKCVLEQDSLTLCASDGGIVVEHTADLVAPAINLIQPLHMYFRLSDLYALYLAIDPICAVRVCKSADGKRQVTARSGRFERPLAQVAAGLYFNQKLLDDYDSSAVGSPFAPYIYARALRRVEPIVDRTTIEPSLSTISHRPNTILARSRNSAIQCVHSGIGSAEFQVRMRWVTALIGMLKDLSTGQIHQLSQSIVLNAGKYLIAFERSVTGLATLPQAPDSLSRRLILSAQSLQSAVRALSRLYGDDHTVQIRTSATPQPSNKSGKIGKVNETIEGPRFVILHARSKGGLNSRAKLPLSNGSSIDALSVSIPIGGLHDSISWHQAQWAFLDIYPEQLRSDESDSSLPTLTMAPLMKPPHKGTS